MKKLLSTALAVSILTTMNIAPVFADISTTALPNLPDGVTNSNVTTSGANMNITVGGGVKGAVDTITWKDYNIGKDATVNYEFTNHHQTSINKVDAGGGLSKIYGTIKDSSTTCGGVDCGYNNTSKILLINPNGFLFGDGANVNVNSFTVSTINLYNEDQIKWEKVTDENGNEIEIQNITFKDNNPTGDIIIEGNAQIYGDKGVNLISNRNISYTGSKISTNVGLNYVDNEGNNTAFGKVKIVTADGINFHYGTSGAVKSLSNPLINNEAANKMTITLGSEINSGHIDIRNYSKNAESEIKLNNATLKATKAENGNDGNIWLTAPKNVDIENSTIETVNGSDNATGRNGGDLLITARGKVSLKNTNVDTVGEVNIKSEFSNITVENNSKINAEKDITANGLTGLDLKNSRINGQNVNLKSSVITEITENSNINATNDVNIDGVNIEIRNSKITAGNELFAAATIPYDGGLNNDINLENAELSANNIKLKAFSNIDGDADLTNSKAQIKAEYGNINLKLKNVGDRNNGLVAKAGNDMNIETDGTLSVSSLISGKDMTITANKVIAGLPYTSEQKLPVDTTTPRSYIEVGGEFTSNVATDNYSVTASGERTDDGLYNQRHHIQYGSEEKILLVTKLPISGTPDPGPGVTPDPGPGITPDPGPGVTPDPGPGVTPDPGPTPPVIIPPIDKGDPIPAVKINDNQAAMLNKLPQKPQHIANANNISDGRTTFIDVFAAASQIEVDDEE